MPLSDDVHMAPPDEYRILERYLSPAHPISSPELLHGRKQELNDIGGCLGVSAGTPVIFGNRGVGKTSLAKTAAQQYTASDREPIYVACPPLGQTLTLLREASIRLSELAIEMKAVPRKSFDIEAHVGLTPSVRFAVKNARQETPVFKDISEAVRVIKDFDKLIPDSARTVVILDELEELEKGSQKDLAYFLKQLGDQEFGLKFILVGIADNVHGLIGAHASVPRYIRNVELGPLPAQALMDIVSRAAEKLGIHVPSSANVRIAIVGNGYPHFAHLMGLSLLQEALEAGQKEVTREIFDRGVQRAVRGSREELKASYEAATQRGRDDYRNVVWTLADIEFADARTDQIEERYAILADRLQWEPARCDVAGALTRLRTEEYGGIVMHTPKRYGATEPSERRYRHHRFTNSLMRGYVRLRAQAEGILLGGGEAQR
jgi:Cdc6-like AAA superfamily ATPase